MFQRCDYQKVNFLFKLKQNVSYSKSAWAVRKDYFNAHSKSDLVAEALEVITVNKPNDWSRVQEFILNHKLNNRGTYNSVNIDSRIMRYALQNKKHADSYFCYLQENKKPNLATIGTYLKCLYSGKIEDISTDQQEKIIKICADVRKDYPILDTLTSESILCALSVTKKWENSVELLKEIKLTTLPSAKAYSYIIAAAFLNNNQELAWEIFNELLQCEKNPTSVVYDSYLAMTKRKKDSIKQNLEKMFEFMKENSLIWPYDVVNELISFGNKQKALATVHFSGTCSCCKTNLKKFELTEEEFFDLKKVFLEKAMIGKDIFIKSDPEEMESFKGFIKNMPKFDVALDGLNIAYSGGNNKGAQNHSNMVASVVSYFVERNKSVLLLGRLHMTKWPKSTWNYIKNNATIFLTKNISQDDPYLLYCTLSSGPNTILVSRDLMRSHRFLLTERKYKILFDRWLSQRQYQLLTINPANKPIFKIPPQFSPVAQNCGNMWHIPYEAEPTTTVNKNYQKTWICLNLDK